MLPWLAAAIRSGIACASAPMITSTTRVLASTLPAATAAGKRALTKQPAGACRLMLRNTPAQAGVWGGMRQRNT